MRHGSITATIGAPRAPLCGALLAMLCGALMAMLFVPAAAGGADRWTVRGAGWGHGIGMSQWGAFGFAKRGRSYRQILGHYYRNTQVTRRGANSVRVLLKANRSRISFRGATEAAGRRLNPRSVYGATRERSNVVLRSRSGRRLRVRREILRVRGGSTVRLLGMAGNSVRDGLYRGSLEVRTASGRGLNAVNAIGLERYVQGVVPAESPPLWPAAALEAQAVAARTYALATNVGGKGFDQYPDTRSQVYRGKLGETPTTNAAVSRTRGEIVTYNGRVATTFFFSTSGGHTENVENVFTSSPPRPWLRGVRDPYDGSSPYHRWGPFTWSSATFKRKLGGLVKGSFRGIKVLKRGASPRVVKARVRGSRGDTTVTGPQLRSRLGLRDTWFYVRRASTK